MEKKTTGKKIGTSAFIVSEIIVIFVVCAVIVNVFMEKTINTNLISALLMFQSSVFITVWGAKASSNFAKKKESEK